MGKVIVLLFLAVLIANVIASCPSSSQVKNCSPSCTSINDCQPGYECCPDICNSKSCYQTPGGVGKGKEGYKQVISGGAGTYCNGMKCSPSQKCISEAGKLRCK